MKNFTDIINEARGEDPQLRREYERLKTKIRAAKAKGQDVTQLEAERVALYDRLVASRSGGPTPSANPSPKSQLNPGAIPSTPKGPTKRPAGSGKDWDEGYKAAIEAIKKAQSGQGGSGSGGASGGDSGLEGIPQDPSQQQGQENKSSSSTGSGSRSRNGKQSGQGVVRPEDCSDISGGELDKTPGTAGGMISKQTGDKLAESEGYSKEGGNDEAIAKDWEDRAKRAASQMAGKGEGYERLKANFDNLYKATKDWKKELKKIVGQSISPDDKRQAYANKNILISQDRIARTDKDKYDCLSYMVCAIDTSGSMTQEYMNQCLMEIYQVALAKKPLKLVVIQFDTRITDIQEFTNLGDLKRKMHNYSIKGGGGTECKPIFDLLLKDKKYSRLPAELVMIFTDGYLDQYKRNPRTMKNLCWVVVDHLSFEVKYKDANTKCVRIKSEDMGK